jgi:hypothetical protein
MFANTKALTLAGLEKEEGRIGGVMVWAGWRGKIANSASVSSGTFGVGCTATSVRKWAPLKIIN